MKKIAGIITALFFTFLFLVPSFAQEGTLDGALQYKNLNESSSGFDKYKSLPDGFVFENLDLRFGSGPYWFIDAYNLGLADQEAKIRGVDYGKWNLDISWNQIIRRYTRNSQSIFSTPGNGHFYIPDTVQSAAESAADLSDLPSIFSPMYASVDGNTLMTKRDVGTISARCTAINGWTFEIGARRENRSGNFPVSNGFYNRFTPTPPLGDRFESIGVELPVPMDFRTVDLNASVAYNHKYFGVKLGWNDSSFRNDLNALYWDNPYRITNASGTAKSAMGFLDFYPDNDAKNLSLEWNVNLPASTKIVGSIVWGKMTQDQPFLPFSINNALVDANTGLNATDPALLPAPSLDGNITTRSQIYEITSSFIKPLTVRARYESFDYNNHTPLFIMPGSATYGDSNWATNWGGLPIESHPNAYWKEKKSLDLTWRIAKGYRLAAGIEREDIDRDLRKVKGTHENIRWVIFSMTPVSWFDFKANYKWQKHKIEAPGYDGGHHEFEEFRMFDVADRDTRMWSVDMSFYPASSLDINLYTHRFRNNFVDTSYGLQYDRGYDIGADLSWSKDRWTIYGNLSRNRRANFMQSLSKSDVNGSGGFNELNTWFSYLRDTVDVATLGLVFDIIPKKSSIEFYYSFERGKGIRNDGNVAGIIVDNAQSWAFPNTVDRDHLFEGKFRYQINDHWGMGARLMYDTFRLDDYAWNDFKAYNPNISNDILYRFFFLNSKYGSYNGFVATTFASYRF